MTITTNAVGFLRGAPLTDGNGRPTLETRRFLEAVHRDLFGAEADTSTLESQVAILQAQVQVLQDESDESRVVQVWR